MSTSQDVTQLVEAATQAGEDPLIGQVLGQRYRVIRPIASGGMATVYAARHSLINRPVAIKVLRPEYATDLDCVERFVNEGRAAGTLGHPNIVESLDMGITPDGKPYLVLELLDGVSIHDEIQRGGALPLSRAAHIARQIAGALAAAHANGIVHRDLKSDNVFLLDRDQVKVIDFGISKFVGLRPSDTQKGKVFGTPDFMPPEQIRDPQRADERSDAYALGMILYHMLSGRLPYEDVPFPLVLERILHGELPALETQCPDLPFEVRSLVGRALAKSPTERPQSMDEFEKVLARYDRERVAAAAVAPRPMPTPTLPPPRSRWRPDLRYVAAALGLAALCVVGIGFARRSPHGSATKPTPPMGSLATARAASPAAAAAVPQAPLRPLQVSLNLVSTAPGAQATVRGRTVTLPYHAEVSPADMPEAIRVSAPRYQGRLFWITLDRTRYLAVDLKLGHGIVEATPLETAIALGEAAPPAPSSALSTPPPQPQPQPRAVARPAAFLAGLAGMQAASTTPQVPLTPTEVPAGRIETAAQSARSPQTGSASAPATGSAPGSGSAPSAAGPPPPAPPAPTVLPYSAFVSSHRIGGVEPHLPAVLRKSIEEGSAQARICVAADGHVSDVRIVRASAGLDETIRAAVRTWRYRPFTSQGHTIPVCFDMPFQLKRE